MACTPCHTAPSLPCAVAVALGAWYWFAKRAGPPASVAGGGAASGSGGGTSSGPPVSDAEVGIITHAANKPPTTSVPVNLAGGAAPPPPAALPSGAAGLSAGAAAAGVAGAAVAGAAVGAAAAGQSSRAEDRQVAEQARQLHTTRGGREAFAACSANALLPCLHPPATNLQLAIHFSLPRPQAPAASLPGHSQPATGLAAVDGSARQCCGRCWPAGQH